MAELVVSLVLGREGEFRGLGLGKTSVDTLL